MAQTQKVQGVATSIHTDDAGTHIVYHRTAVVSYTADRITLRTGGWRTNTTKLRMNQAGAQFQLGYTVSQRDFGWFVRLPSGEELPFLGDEMSFPR